MCCTALVGRLGSGPLAAVGLSGALFNFCNFLFSFLMIVTTPKVAAAVAQRNLDKVAIFVKATAKLSISLRRLHCNAAAINFIMPRATCSVRISEHGHVTGIACCLTL